MPANVRIRGVDMQLDLKIDQRTLAAASDISRAINEVVSSVSSLPADSGRQAILRIPSLNSVKNLFSLTIFLLKIHFTEKYTRKKFRISILQSRPIRPKVRRVAPRRSRCRARRAAGWRRNLAKSLPLHRPTTLWMRHSVKTPKLMWFHRPLLSLRRGEKATVEGEVSTIFR